MGFIFSFIKKIIKLSIKLSLYLVVVAAIILLIPNLPPYTKFTSIELAPTQERVGPLAPNNALNNANREYKGKLLGPEAFQLLNGELYTSLATGEIVKISPGGHVTFVTKFGQPCTGISKEHVCGRPLGFQIDDKGKSLYAADAYHGIWKVDLQTDKKQLLVSPRVEIGKRLPKLFNSIALGKNGDFYWTDSSSDFNLKDGVYSVLANPSGRLFYYNAAKNQSEVLIDDLWFANGLVLSPTNDFLVITETCKFRVLKYHIAGPKKGKTEVFVDGLPGIPDNVRVLPDGSGVLVALYTVFDDEHPLLTRSMSTTPLVRKFLARLQRLIEIPFEYLNSIYPHIVFEEIVYHIGHFKSISALSPPMSGLVQLDWNGNIVASYYNTDGSLGHISEAIVYNNKLYTGSPHVQDFIGSVPVPPLLKKAFEPAKNTEVPKVQTKPQQAKPVQQEKPKVEEKPKVVKETVKVEEKPKIVKPKVEEKPKAPEKPKVQPPPKVQEKPKAKVEEKPKVQPKPKVEEQPKAQPKPKVEDKKQAPKVETPPPQQAKPTNEKPKAQQPPKTTPPPSAKPETPKKPQEQPKPTSTTPKPQAKSAPASKPTENKKASEPKKAAGQEAPKPQGKPKEQIPIKEEIPSDTAKPPKETLKVIKKGGVPTEIPVPNQ